jgi:Short C-terminal domain/Phospholipase_D-nuclease N-terminal
MSFWDVVWFICISFLFVAYLMMLFWILTDLFRDHQLSGWAKAIWVVALLFFPLLTALVYMIARGRGMAERSASEAARMQKQQEAYIRDVASSSQPTSPVDQISQARALLDSGAISQAEYESLKAHALGGAPASSPTTGNGHATTTAAPGSDRMS